MEDTAEDHLAQHRGIGSGEKLAVADPGFNHLDHMLREAFGIALVSRVRVGMLADCCPEQLGALDNSVRRPDGRRVSFRTGRQAGWLLPAERLRPMRDMARRAALTAAP